LTDSSEGPAEVFEREQTEAVKSDGLAKALGSLDDRSRRIIRARWLAESDPKTLHELADEFGVSAERIRQIEAKAMQRMKKEMAALETWGPPAFRRSSAAASGRRRSPPDSCPALPPAGPSRSCR